MEGYCIKKGVFVRLIVDMAAQEENIYTLYKE